MSRSPYKGGGPKYTNREGVRCVGNGIDALEVWMQVRFSEEVIRLLADAKATAERLRSPSEISMGGEPWRLEPGIDRHRGQAYTFRLTNGRTALGISRPRGSAPSIVFVRFECRALWETGPHGLGALTLQR